MACLASVRPTAKCDEYAPDLRRLQRARAVTKSSGTAKQFRNVKADLTMEAEGRGLFRSHEVLEKCRKGIQQKGWASPWIAESLDTPDLLSQSGLIDTRSKMVHGRSTCLDENTQNGRLLSDPLSAPGG